MCAFVQDSVFGTGHSFEIDECGEVESLSELAAILIPFYYAPLILLMVLIVTLLVVHRKLLYHFRLATIAYGNCLCTSSLYRRIWKINIKGQVYCVNSAAELSNTQRERRLEQQATPFKSFYVEFNDENETIDLRL